MSERRTKVGDTSSAGETLLQDGSRWLLKAVEGGKGKDPGLVPALDKALKVIAYLNLPHPEEPALPQIAQATGVTKSHCHAILKTLVAHDCVAFDNRTKTYRLHPGILKFVSSVIVDSGNVDIIRPILQRLVHRIELPVMLAQVLSDGTFAIVERYTAQHVLEISYPIGYRLPRDACAHMRAALAWRSEAEIDAWFKAGKPKRYTRNSVVDERTIRQEMKLSRARGYARSVGEFTEGLMAIALPIFDRDGRPAYVVSCVSLQPIMLEREQDVAEHLARAVTEVHEALGSRVPESATPPSKGRGKSRKR